MPERPRCLTDLLSGGWEGVLIPIVQRDYAQGRVGEQEVRLRFLRALRSALELHRSGGKALDLDFVYGYRLDEPAHFVPIDGQQRLTTLFLLHWYLAAVDGLSEHFRALATRGEGGSRFQYAVRPSSDDFFRELASAQLSIGDLLSPDRGGDNAVSKTIRNECWFYRSWDLDPTVSASLTMLDAIHREFRGTSGLYQHLAGPSPAITFQFLDLEDFGLGDELYIKMNARGRALTRFEVFKSELEKFVRTHNGLAGQRHASSGLPLNEHIGVQFDTTWSHLLWTLLRREFADDGAQAGAHDWTRLTDPHMLNLVRTIAIVAYPGVEVTGDEAIRTDKALEALHNGVVTTFQGYVELGAASESFVVTFTRLMDRWSQESGAAGSSKFLTRTEFYDEVAMFRTIRNDAPRRSGQSTKPKGSVTYTDLVRFAAYCIYLASDRDSEADLDEWMRVVSNLARNTPIEKGEHLRRALNSMRQLLPACGDSVLQYLAGGGDVGFFLDQQVREERLKAQLILKNDKWQALIQRGELHAYFSGQIEFLFSFSGLLVDWLARGACDWTDEQDAAYRAEFTTWLTKSATVFGAPGGGLSQQLDYAWERALLCRGNYLLAKGSNWSLLVDSDRDVSWKRLLRGDMGSEERRAKRDIVRVVLSEVDPGDLDGSLRSVINAGVKAEEDGDDSTEWRTRLVDHPHFFAYCKNRWLRWDRDGGLFLLRGVRRGRHRELFSWHLGEGLKEAVAEQKLTPFTRVECPEESGAAERAGIDLYVHESADPRNRITYEKGSFHIYDVIADGTLLHVTSTSSDGMLAEMTKLAQRLKAHATSQ